MPRLHPVLVAALLLLPLRAAAQNSAQDGAPPGDYRNFEVAVYARVYEVRQMADLDWLRERFDVMQRHVAIDKIYLETHRDTILADDETLRRVKRFFEERGVRTAGGITLTVYEPNRFENFCYSDPEHRAWVRHVVEHTARHFDELILDDFFFTSCKADVEIAAKGDRSWTDYRLALMTEAAQSLVLGPAKAVNPDVIVVIKYPNWYEHFQGLGFDLETEPPLFDGIYTGTETRDAVMSAQHLQPYLGYNIFRYFENIKPGGNGGGWVDTGGMRYLDRYAEQLWITLFAKAPEITLFDFRQLQRPLLAEHRAPWQDAGGTSFDFDSVAAPFRQSDGSLPTDLTIAPAVGYTLARVDRFLGELGNPIGVPSYRPFHAKGEDFLHNFIGMAGVPVALRPAFPDDARTILLTESAKHDPEIVAKIERRLRAGANVVVTSGLLKALEGRGIEDIVELSVSDRRALVDAFNAGTGGLVHAEKKILIPQIEYLTNDSWEIVGAVDGMNGWPLFHDADYSAGQLYVWTIPDNFADLYVLPPEVLNRIRQIVAQDLFVRIDGPALVSLFAYDNDTFIVESFRDEATAVRVVTEGRFTRLRDLETGEVVAGTPAPEQDGWRRSRDAGKNYYDVTVPPHSFRVFRAE